MRLLLDTHIWIWALQRPERISRPVRRQIENPKNEVYLSPISLWEAHLLEQRGKLRVKPNFAEWVDSALAHTPMREAPFSFAVATEASRIQLPQMDLGDVFLAATAKVFDLTLVTSDQQLPDCPGLKTLANE